MIEFDFKHPDYDAVFRERVGYLENLRLNSEILPGLKAHFATHPVEFINAFGTTFDPRNAEVGLPTMMPFILFERQKEFIQWLYNKWRGREDGLVEKSRDMGVSYLCVAFAVWLWLFHAGTVSGFGSRKEEYVDKLGDPKSLFWKARQFIDMLPREFIPLGYNEKVHAPYMRIINPENGAAIVGESGDNIGRGNRTSIYFKDESAFYDHAELIEAALAQTSNVKIDVSTPNGNGNVFYRKRHSGKIDVFTFHWTQDPRKDEEWYARQCENLDPVIVAQEIDIDYNASVTDCWIHGDLIAAAQRNGPADVEAVGKWMIGVDAAHFGDDESVIHMRKGRLNLDQVHLRKADGVQLAGRVEEEVRQLGGVDKIAAIVIELDGPGVSCYDQLKLTGLKSKVVGIHTGTRLQDDQNYNLRAKLWRSALDYLRNPPVVLPKDGDFKAQLASVKYKYRDGLLLMQSKKEYKSDVSHSPDRADAFVLTMYEDIPNQDWDTPIKPKRKYIV